MGKLTQLRRSSKQKSGGGRGKPGQFAGLDHLTGSRGRLEMANKPIAKQAPGGFASAVNAQASKLAIAKQKQKLKDKRKHERRQAAWSGAVRSRHARSAVSVASADDSRLEIVHRRSKSGSR